MPSEYLCLKHDGQDRLYNISLVSSQGRHHVFVEYGYRSGVLKKQLKGGYHSRAIAENIYNSLIAQKIKKGYVKADISEKIKPSKKTVTARAIPKQKYDASYVPERRLDIDL
jgi:predicted DNA-binding WGR domain protein